MVPRQGRLKKKNPQRASVRTVNHVKGLVQETAVDLCSAAKQCLEEAFNDAIFKNRRERGQPLTAFLGKKVAAFAELKKQGLDFLGVETGRHLLGRLVIKQGNFTVGQKQRIKVLTNGSVDADTAVRNAPRR